MTKRKKPPSDTAILEMIDASGNDLAISAKALEHTTLAALIKRLAKMPLRSKYRALVLKMAYGNVSVAAKQIGISRQQLHKDITKDKIILEGWAEGKESRSDSAEDQLVKNWREGKEASLIFYLKTQCRDRGYIEKQELTGPGGEPLDMKVTINFVEPLKSGKPRAVRQRSNS